MVAAAGSLAALAHSLDDAIQQHISGVRRKMWLYEQHLADIQLRAERTSHTLVDRLSHELRAHLVTQLVAEYRQRLAEGQEEDQRRVRWHHRQAKAVLSDTNVKSKVSAFFQAYDGMIAEEWQLAAGDLRRDIGKLLMAHEAAVLLEPHVTVPEMDLAAVSPDVLGVVGVGGLVSIACGIGAWILPGGLGLLGGGALIAAGMLALTKAVGMAKLPTRDELVSKSANTFSEALQDSLGNQIQELREKVVLPRLEAIKIQMVEALTRDAAAAILGGRGESESRAEVGVCEQLSSQAAEVYARLRELLPRGQQITVDMLRITATAADLPKTDGDSARRFLSGMLSRACTNVSIIDRRFSPGDFALLHTVPGDVSIQLLTFDEAASEVWHVDFLDVLVQFRKTRPGTVRVRTPRGGGDPRALLGDGSWVLCDDEYVVQVSGPIATLDAPETKVTVRRDDGSVHHGHFGALWETRAEGVQLVEL